MSLAQSLTARMIGTVFVQRGLLSESQIRVALEIQRETGQQLGQILVERFGVSRQELASVVAEQWADMGRSMPSATDAEANESWRRLGDIFVERGFVTPEQLEQALERQRETGERVGEALVAQGSISKFELAGALAEQMSVLTEAEPSAAQALEATVVELATRPDEPVASVELEPIVSVEPEPVAGAELELELVPSPEPEPVASAEPESVESVELEPIVSVEPEPVAGAELELELVPSPEPEPVASAEPESVESVEPEPIVSVEPEPVAGAELELELVPSPEPEPVASAEPEPVESAELEPVVSEPELIVSADPEPMPAPTFLPTSLASPVPKSPFGWVAFASTTTGYRLVHLSGPLPMVGETLDVPDVGQLLVLRLGRSPLPADQRTCVFLEQLVRADSSLAG